MIALLATLAFIHPQGQVEGAEKMLRSMGVVVSVPAKETSFARLRRDVDKYIATSDQMTPKAAADVFMKLLAEWRIAKMDPGAYSDDSTGSLNTPQALVEALPRPERVARLGRARLV